MDRWCTEARRSLLGEVDAGGRHRTTPGRSEAVENVCSDGLSGAAGSMTAPATREASAMTVALPSP